MMSQSVQLPRAQTLPIEVLTSPFVRFAKMEASSGLLLLTGTIAALIWANSPWEQSYHAIWHTQVSIGFGRLALSESRHEWINDGLMSVFFFLVGLEIKREVLIGELSSPRKAAFPFIAAVGGAVVPAILYLCVTFGRIGQKGWGIPMATDIAFTLGVLTLLGNRVPVSLKVFVTALAIVDDILAVLVIALFYTDQIHVLSLAVGLAGVAVSWGANLLGVRKPAIYAVIGIFVWFAVLKSGVHATVAGVLLAFTIPARTYIDHDVYLKRTRGLLDRFEVAVPNSSEAHAVIHSVAVQCELVESPLQRIEHLLHPWISFLVLPLFAFANAGVRILGNGLAATTHPVSIGIVLGLFIGKPLGIWLLAWISAKTGLGMRPPELSWRSILGAGCLSGIGFTMSLFIATLALGDGALLDMAKIGTMAGSLAAGIFGSMILLNRQNPSSKPAEERAS
jgi:NhaA family Na+:H+ antiporter